MAGCGMGSSPHAVRPCCIANNAAAALVETPILAYAFCRWWSAVFAEMPRRWPICLVCSPRATMAITWVSRSVRPAGWAIFGTGRPAAASTAATASGSMRPALAAAASDFPAASGDSGRPVRPGFGESAVRVGGRQHPRRHRDHRDPRARGGIRSRRDVHDVRRQSTPAWPGPSTVRAPVRCGTRAAECVPTHPSSGVQACSTPTCSPPPDPGHGRGPPVELRQHHQPSCPAEPPHRRPAGQRRMSARGSTATPGRRNHPSPPRRDPPRHRSGPAASVPAGEPPPTANPSPRT